MTPSSLIMVNYRTQHHVVEALSHLESLPDEAEHQIIVVDNDPKNSLKTALKRLSLFVEYIPSATNLGFAGGVNLGLTRADRETIILLNPDARPEQGCLAGLGSILKGDPGYAVAGPRLVPFDPCRSLTPSATWRDPGLLSALIEYTPVRRCFRRDWLLRHYFVDPGSISHTSPCAMVQGACFAFKRSWLERVGGFDAKRFFLYFEETDFCLRVRQAGGIILYCPEHACRHEGGASLENRSQDVHRFWQSYYQFLAKHYGLAWSRCARIVLTLGLLVEYASYRVKQRLGLFKDDFNSAGHSDVIKQQLRFHLRGAGHGRQA